MAIAVSIAPTAPYLVRRSRKATAARLQQEDDLASTDLRLEEQGSLSKPSPVGRLTRFVSCDTVADMLPNVISLRMRDARTRRDH